MKLFCRWYARMVLTPKNKINAILGLFGLPVAQAQADKNLQVEPKKGCSMMGWFNAEGSQDLGQIAVVGP